MPLSPSTLRILRAVVAAIRPRGHGFDLPIDEDVLRDVQAFFPHLPGPMRLGFPVGLRLLEYGPPLFARRFTRFSRMPPDEGCRYLADWLHAGGIRGALVLGLKALVSIAFYQHPQALAVLGVDWQGRADLLVRRRAELVGGPAA